MLARCLRGTNIPPPGGGSCYIDRNGRTVMQPLRCVGPTAPPRHRGSLVVIIGTGAEMAAPSVGVNEPDSVYWRPVGTSGCETSKTTAAVGSVVDSM